MESKQELRAMSKIAGMLFVLAAWTDASCKDILRSMEKMEAVTSWGLIAQYVDFLGGNPGIVYGCSSVEAVARVSVFVESEVDRKVIEASELPEFVKSGMWRELKRQLENAGS